MRRKEIFADKVVKSINYLTLREWVLSQYMEGDCNDK